MEKSSIGIKGFAKIVLASLLVVTLLGLSALAVNGSGFKNGGLASLAAPIAQKVVNNSTPAQADQATNTQAAPAQQSGGIVDARTAVRKAGGAVVTIVNTLAANTNGSGRNGGGNPFPNVPNTPGTTPNVPGTIPGAPSGGTAEGSGVIIDTNGDIVTNNHVIAGESSLEVIFADGTRAPATLVGADPYSDLAVIKVNKAVSTIVQFANSDQLELGQPAVAIGSPLGDYTNTVTEGIISGLHRTIQDSGTTSLRDLIQTDAAINPGNSGGPLLDINGNVVGINVAVVRTSSMGDVAEGLGFAIPSNTVQSVSAQLIKSGSVTRPFLGITYEDITPQVAAYYNLALDHGIYVTDVSAGSPAEKAGIVPQSIITKFDGVDLTSSDTLLQQLMKRKVGDSVKVSVLAPSSTTEKEVTIVLGARPAGQ
ncbi:MAG: trypsin-like peptidase domain-containing protein [Chloroflexi bacterium]|nr:trypsin-like peptidase domain-containing protein [Chloroflexota bacterium]